MIDELRKSMNAMLYERVTSPLLGTYLISWCGWNYKVFLLIFSSMEYDKQIERLNIYFSGINCYSAFSIPLAWTLFYIFFYPYLAKYVFGKWEKYIADKEKIRQDVKKDVPITQEQADKLRQDIARQSVEFENRLNDKNDRIKLLEESGNNNLIRIDEKEKEIVKLKEQFQNMNTELSAFYDRKKMIEECDIKPNHKGLMYSHKGNFKGMDLCPSCLNASPPKLIPLPEHIPHNQQFIKCPSCKGEYLNHNYQPEEKSKRPPAIAVDNEFLCWISKMDKNNALKYCPTCAIRENELRLAELAKVSENEYKCVLCSKSYTNTRVSTT